MRFKIDWAIDIVGSKFIVFALFHLVLEGNFPTTNPWGGGLYLEGRFNGRFFVSPVWGGLYLEGLIFGVSRYSPIEQVVFWLGKANRTVCG